MVLALDDPPLPVPHADERVLRDIVREIEAREELDEPAILDVDILLPIKLRKRPGRNLRWPKTTR